MKNVLIIISEIIGIIVMIAGVIHINQTAGTSIGAIFLDIGERIRMLKYKRLGLG